MKCETIYVFDLMETEIYLDTKGKRQKKMQKIKKVQRVAII